MSSTRKRTITVHISPYVGGLAPETHDFIRRLNEEARRLRTGVSFIALGNRILADGIIERALKFANTLGALVLRRAFADGYLAHRPQPRWETPAIEGEEVVLRRGSSGHRKELRRFEKNNLPFECDCTICGGRFECRSIKEYVERQGICWGCGFENKIKIAAETLYRLVCAIPRAERDSEEIYPDDFRKVLIPLPLQSNWNWRELERRYREGMLPCGVSSGALLGRDSLGLRDYAEPARLLFKYGRYELVTRQKAASSVRHIRIALEPTVDYLALLVPTATQRALERAGRLYKNSQWPSKQKRCLFNKCEAGSYRKLQAFRGAADPHKRVEEFDAYRLEVTERWQAVADGVVDILIPGMPSRHVDAKRHAALAASRDSYNAESGSYWNGARLSRLLRQGGAHGRGSLNIPREAIEARDHMIVNMEHDFGQDEQKVA